MSQAAQTVCDANESTSPSSVFQLPFGANLLAKQKGVFFKLWAPDAEEVELVLNQEQPVAMTLQANGWAELILPHAKVGDRYGFRINQDLVVPDPASRYQPETVHRQSEIVDPNAFQWGDTAWTGRPWEEAVIYELHVGTFTPEGTYQGIINKLDYLVDLGITAIELMPLSQFPGEQNWGYDGVLPFAPENCYGTPDDLKALIQAAHGKGLMVFIDVVYNHFGPDGNYLPLYAKSFFTKKHVTPWGEAIDFSEKPPVRDFFIQNALYWIHEFHADGLRLDAVHAITDDSQRHVLSELADTVRQSLPKNRHIHLILENDLNQARFLSGTEKEAFNAQWNDDFHHAVHVLLSGEATSYYADYDAASSAKSAAAHFARCLESGFAYQANPSPFRNGEIRGEKSDHLPSTAFINFIQNHDQIGNRPFGDRLSTLVDERKMKAALAILFLSPSIPLLFMGEEWQSKTPFQFFCDFESPLREAVTEGRRKEFSHNPAFSKPENRNKIPDPCQKSTFEASKLNWNDLDNDPYSDSFQFTRQLLHLRQKKIVPLLKSSIQTPATTKPFIAFQKENAALIAWPLSNTKRLMLGFNFNKNVVFLETDENKSTLQDLLNSSELIFENTPQSFEQCQKGQLLSDTVIYWIAHS